MSDRAYRLHELGMRWQLKARAIDLAAVVAVRSFFTGFPSRVREAWLQCDGRVGSSFTVYLENSL
jgi:hypothetical protein